MNSSDVMVEHFAVTSFVSSPSTFTDCDLVKSGQESLLYTDTRPFRHSVVEDKTGFQDEFLLAKGHPNRLQSFEHSFGWIRNLAANDFDMSYLSHGFLSIHEGSPSAHGWLDKSSDQNGWDQFCNFPKKDLTSGLQCTEGSGHARRAGPSSPAPGVRGGSSLGDVLVDCQPCDASSGLVHSLGRPRHHSEPNVFELSGNKSLAFSGCELPRSHSEALLALPVFKQESLESGFQYILSASTSPASKMNEETVTYLNQGQPYELKLKKYGDFSEIKGRTLKSIIRVVFHDRRLQYMEREQLELWKQTRPGERILDIDIPLSYAVQNMKVDPNKLNSIEFTWDPAKDTGVFIKVNSISTEFTAKKHGGEKGVPFRIQVETYVLDDGDYRLAHCSSCQIKVFKPKGADRKHKTDREKMERRSEAEKEKYQPSYECTVLAEIPLEQAVQYLDNLKQQTLKMDSDSFYCRGQDFPFQQGNAGRQGGSTPQHQRAGSDISDNSDNPMTPKQASSSPPMRNFQYIADSSSSDARADLPKTPSWGSFSGTGEMSGANSWVTKAEEKKPDTSAVKQGSSLSPTANAGQVSNWLKNNRFAGYVSTFSNFSGADLLRLTRDDLVQICGLADGIRMDNALQSKNVRPRLTIYVCQGNPRTSPNQPGTTASGSKKPDSLHNGSNAEGLSNGSNKPLGSAGGAMRQLSPSGPSPNSRFTMHRHQDTSPCGSSDSYRSGPSPIPIPSSGVGSSGSVPAPLKYKRQLVEDMDSDDQDEEKVVTSTKKQRTRPLELSKKEVFHAIFLEQLTVSDLIEKFAGLFSVAVKQIVEICLVGPNNIDILVNDSVVQNLKDKSRFALEATLVDNTHDQYKLHMQPME